MSSPSYRLSITDRLSNPFLLPLAVTLIVMFISGRNAYLHHWTHYWWLTVLLVLVIGVLSLCAMLALMFAYFTYIDKSDEDD